MLKGDAEKVRDSMARVVKFATPEGDNVVSIELGCPIHIRSLVWIELLPGPGSIARDYGWHVVCFRFHQSVLDALGMDLMPEMAVCATISEPCAQQFSAMLMLVAEHISSAREGMSISLEAAQLLASR